MSKKKDHYEDKFWNNYRTKFLLITPPKRGVRSEFKDFVRVGNIYRTWIKKEFGKSNASLVNCLLIRPKRNPYKHSKLI